MDTEKERVLPKRILGGLFLLFEVLFFLLLLAPTAVGVWGVFNYEQREPVGWVGVFWASLLTLFTRGLELKLEHWIAVTASFPENPESAAEVAKVLSIFTWCYTVWSFGQFGSHLLWKWREKQ